MSAPAPFPVQLAAFNAEQLLNYRYAISLRIAGCERRGTSADKPREMLEQVREEMRKRGLL